jgi:hypothetical protein
MAFLKRISSVETNRFSASKEIPRILWNQNVHYCIQNGRLSF